MKYVLVTFRAATTDNPKGGYRYPKRYDAQLVQNSGTGVIQYDHLSGFDADGKQECLIRVDDSLADRFAGDQDMRILSDSEADAWVAGNAQLQQAPAYQVDMSMVAALQARASAGITLTSVELDYLDPDHNSGGIRRADYSKEAIFKVRS